MDVVSASQIISAICDMLGVSRWVIPKFLAKPHVLEHYINNLGNSDEKTRKSAKDILVKPENRHFQ